MTAADSDAIVVQKRRADSLLDAPEWIDGDPPLGEQASLAEATVAWFRAAGAELLDTVTPHLWAYYRSEVEEAPPEWRPSLPDLAAGADIWSEVELNEASIGFGGDEFSPATVYLSLSGEVSWEPEHGLDFVFGDGAIVKVGPCDGHLTNAHAYGDLALLGVVVVDGEAFRAHVRRRATASDTVRPPPEQPELPL